MKLKDIYIINLACVEDIAPSKFNATSNTVTYVKYPYAYFATKSHKGLFKAYKILKNGFKVYAEGQYVRKKHDVFAYHVVPFTVISADVMVKSLSKETLLSIEESFNKHLLHKEKECITNNE